jgi:hypothetical protein
MTAPQELFDPRPQDRPEPGRLAGDADQDGWPRLVAAKEPRGVVYTRSWVAELVLDLAGYRVDRDLASLRAVEPAAGEGALLLPMIRRLVASVRAHGGTLSGARDAIRAYELDAATAARLTDLVGRQLRDCGVRAGQARDLAAGWVRTGDYLLDPQRGHRADVVVDNPRISGTTMSQQRRWRRTGACTRRWWAGGTSMSDSSKRAFGSSPTAGSSASFQGACTGEFAGHSMRSASPGIPVPGCRGRDSRRY